MPTRVIAINATLKKSSGEPSSTDAMIELVAGLIGMALTRGAVASNLWGDDADDAQAD